MAEFDRMHRRQARREAAMRIAKGREPQGPGRPLEPGVRASAERSFGHDFSQVRIHNDAAAAASAQAVNAKAYTAGSDLVFEPGAYDPASKDGEWLLAHELAHVVQQEDAPVPSTAWMSHAGEPAEAEADRAADRMVGGLDAGLALAASTGVPAVQRYIHNPDLFENMPAWGDALGGAADLIGGGGAGLFGGPVGSVLGPAMSMIGTGLPAAGEALGGMLGGLGEMDPSWWMM